MRVAVEGEAGEEETERAGEVMVGHTPGPWRVGDAGGTVFGPKGTGSFPEVVATVMTTHGRKKANARLIAAAPDLLEALEKITQHAFDDDTSVQDILTDFESMRDIARAAIAKATEPSPVPSA